MGAWGACSADGILRWERARPLSGTKTLQLCSSWMDVSSGAEGPLHRSQQGKQGCLYVQRPHFCQTCLPSAAS